MKKMHNENKSKHFLGQTKTEKTVSIIICRDCIKY